MALMAMKGHDSRTRILMIAPRVLTPNIDGGSLRMYHLMAILNDLSYRVTFVPSFPYSWPPYTSRLQKDTEHLQKSGVEVPPTSTMNPVEDHLQRNGERYAIVILGEEYVAAKHIASIRKYCPQAMIAFDTGDLHYLRHYREARVSGNVRALRRALQSKTRVLAVAREADCTFVVSPVDKAILERDCPDVRAYVISSIHEVHGSAKPFADRQDMLFIGSFQHAPNLDAVNYLVDEIYPLIRKETACRRLYIIGGDPPVSIKSLSCSDIIVTGYVPDLAQYFDNCRVSVAPLRFGAGVKGKVLTSMSHGVPVVASSIAAEGMYLTDGKDVLVADNPIDFCDAVVSLCEDESLWNDLSKNGANVVSEHFSFRAVRAKLLEWLASMEGGERP